MRLCPPASSSAYAAAGELRVALERSYELEDVPQALRDFAEGKLGKLAVTIL
jgi:hypothetical protein